MNRSPSLFEAERLTLVDSIALTVDSLRVYGERYKHWAIAYSGGKDSSATVTLVAHLIETGEIPAPASLQVLYADTRMELPALQVAAMGVLAELERRGIRTEVVLPPIDDRFFVYILGRGVPPPKHNFRWCTPQLKIEPMLTALADFRAQVGEKLLMITGVRVGESATRDARIAVSCSRDGAECGQGWFQQATSEAVADTLAPLLHWRVCHVWDWLTFDAPRFGFPTETIAEVYGGDEKEELNARTGCIQCPLASRDTALDYLIGRPEWSYLAPLKRLRPLYEELRQPKYRLRKDGSERRKDGSMVKNPMRMGPLTIAARRRALELVLELIGSGVWPQGWDGSEMHGDVMTDQVMAEGVMQALLLDDVA